MMTQSLGCRNIPEKRQIKELQHRIHLLELKGFLKSEVSFDKNCDTNLSRMLDCVNFLLEIIKTKA